MFFWIEGNQVKLGHRYKLFILIIVIVATALFSYGFTVKKDTAENSAVDLKSIPKQVGVWRMTSQQVQASTFEKSFLNDVLFRIYERPDGRVVALAIAYGADQRQNFSIHVPEGCYRAAGYDVTSVGFTRLVQPAMSIKQLVALKGKANESIQFWVVLNGQVVTNHFERKLKQLYYSLLGARAGGVLVRVSTISSAQNSGQDFDMQKEFISALYRSLNGVQRKMLFGRQALTASR